MKTKEKIQEIVESVGISGASTGAGAGATQKPELDEAKQKIVNRLRTIKGHIAGVEKMIEEDKTCDEVLLQVAAIKSSIHKVGLAIMEEHAMHCMITDENGNMNNRDQMEKVIKTLLSFSK